MNCTKNPDGSRTFSYGRPLTARDAGVRALWWREYDKPHTPFRVVAADGVEIRGLHFKNNFETLLIYCHGFLGGKNFAHIRHWVEMLAAGLDVITFDFRGHGESGGATTLGQDELLDLDAVCNYARRFGYRRIVVMGSSMGGAVAIRYAADSNAVNAVVTMGAFAHKQFSVMAMAGLGLLKWSVSRRVMRHSYSTRIARSQPAYSPRDFVARISPRPLLMFHGEHDPLIPVSHAHELFAHAGEPKTLQVIPRAGHDVENLNPRTQALLMDWLGRTR